MATSSVDTPQGKSLQDPQFKEILQKLRRTDNLTNWYYLLRTWLYLAVVLGSTIGFYLYAAHAGWSWWWDVPVTVVAILLVGAGQHQLTGLAHETAHHILFRQRYLNELVSDWLCMFPLFSTTYHYRLQHLAHHQFVNDPERDPDISQLQSSGHWLSFPLSRGQFLRTLLQQLWLPNLVRYTRIRARYNALPMGKHPYVRKDWKPTKLLVRVGIAYLIGLAALLAGLVWWENRPLLAVLPVGVWLAALAFYALVPERYYQQTRLRPVLSIRWVTLQRVTFLTGLFWGLAWLSLLVTPWVVVWFFLLWVVPIFTSFSFFMILRQLVQHGNGDRGWLTNTRVFFVNRLLRFAIFPMGQDYHLPHHLFASVPHYRLRQLHEILMEYPEYRQQAVVVEGYFFPRQRPPVHPTVLDVLGPAYAPRQPAPAWIDHSVLEQDEVVERAELMRLSQS
jgi:fatty acid desaturase